MDAFQPLINLLVVLTVLSIVSERITNLLKLRHPQLNMRALDEQGQRSREYAIGLRSIAVGIVVALAMKANFFELVANLEAPWKTFGWVQVNRTQWVQSAATNGSGPFFYTIAGCALTGAALGFGSKFWHDILGTVYDLRNMARNRSGGQVTSTTGEPTPAE